MCCNLIIFSICLFVYYSYLSLPLEGAVEKGNINCKSPQSFVYPDDIVVIARNITVLNYVLLALEIKANNWD